MKLLPARNYAVTWCGICYGHVSVCLSLAGVLPKRLNESSWGPFAQRLISAFPMLYSREQENSGFSISPKLHVLQSSSIFAHVTYGRGSVLVRRRCDTLCTSGFMDDVMSAHGCAWRVDTVAASNVIASSCAG